MWPVVLISPDKSPINQRFPSGPGVMVVMEKASLSGYVVTEPVVVIRPILPDEFSANQSAPSGPLVIPSKSALPVTWYSTREGSEFCEPVLPTVTDLSTPKNLWF